MIPIAKPAITHDEISAVDAVMESGMLAQGDVVFAFEDEFAQYCGTKHAIAVNSGTAALHAALLACGIGHGDEVIVPDFTFIATATSVSMCGARPVFADVDSQTFNLDPGSVLERITPRTKAILGVHLFGQPFDVSAISDICEDHCIDLVEDAAQAHGAIYEGRRVGGIGRAGCFSFYPTKNMTTGEGGMVTTDDPAIAKRIRRIINHGQSEKYLHTELGYNYRMGNLGAAIGRVQLRRLNAMNTARRENAEYFNTHLSAPGLITPICIRDVEHVYHQYVVRILDEFPMERDAFVSFLRDRGIGTAVHYPIPVHQQPLYKSLAKDCHNSVSAALAKSVLSLPVHPQVTRENCEYICDVISEVM
jgi:perosamine synthetase